MGEGTEVAYPGPETSVVGPADKCCYNILKKSKVIPLQAMKAHG